ncbi:unnamed protein product [Darwinula stevensoni]|uniref:Pyrimidine nucleoside phosphorylase C-terminal domain-containing protein n=1 Tax=Darwinula stevensoni TaxID=69355 RepID=A0A7R9FQL2_9CRUS|nr:unnamed protein product [Darwinula stevensoni]CAG0899357.1 unnamed protein product [Darwinula stevensoni]
MATQDVLLVATCMFMCHPGSLARSEKRPKKVDTGASLGIATVALLTEMDDPIGRGIGNSLEVEESIRYLQGKGPEDFDELVTKLGGHLLHAMGKVGSVEEGVKNVRSNIETGKAMEHFRNMLLAQGVSEANADVLVAGDPWKVLPKASNRTAIAYAGPPGTIKEIDAMKIGKVCQILGATRGASTTVDHSVGVRILKGRGDELAPGTDWVEVFHNKELGQDVCSLLQESVSVDPTLTGRQKSSRILKVVTASRNSS